MQRTLIGYCITSINNITKNWLGPLRVQKAQARVEQSEILCTVHNDLSVLLTPSWAPFATLLHLRKMEIGYYCAIQATETACTTRAHLQCHFLGGGDERILATRFSSSDAAVAAGPALEVST